MKRVFFIAVILILSESAFCQSKTNNQDLNSSTPSKTSQTSPAHRNLSALNFPTVYTFIGNGNWSNQNNWDANGVPPADTSPGSSIYIKSNTPGAKCILDVPYTVKSGTNPTTITIFTGNNLVVPGSLTVK
ncbi:MAG: hypothetical protein ABI297_05560 [Ginsengibacter sp.]